MFVTYLQTLNLLTYSQTLDLLSNEDIVKKKSQDIKECHRDRAKY
jgi:hypothetical protein